MELNSLAGSAGHFAGMPAKLAFLSHAGAMKCEDEMGTPSGIMAHIRDGQVRD